MYLCWKTYNKTAGGGVKVEKSPKNVTQYNTVSSFLCLMIWLLAALSGVYIKHLLTDASNARLRCHVSLSHIMQKAASCRFFS